MQCMAFELRDATVESIVWLALGLFASWSGKKRIATQSLTKSGARFFSLLRSSPPIFAILSHISF